MVKSCCAVGCSNRARKGSGISFHRFPTEKERSSLWIAALRRQNWTPTKYTWVCSAHFIAGKSEDKLSPDYVPSIFDFVKSPVKRRKASQLQAYDRRKQARQVRSQFSPLQAEINAATSLLELGNVLPTEGDIDMEGCPVINSTEASVSTTETQTDLLSTCTATTETQTDLSMTCIAELEHKCELLQKERYHLFTSVQSLGINEISLQPDAKVKFYTGLPSFGILKTLFDFVAPHIPDHRLSAVPKFQQFCMVLMKLRLNLADADLAHRFGVCQSLVSKNWRKWIDAMYIRLKPLIKWPGREELMKTMPRDFLKSFPKCICIIDCFEVFLERPSDLMARAQTYSNYKHHNTVKFLIAITPQGVISFASKGWGGRVSDQHLTENCGLLSHLIHNDQILADRGFTVQDSVGLYCAEIVLPPFTRGKKQLSKIEIDKARKLSRVRIHVERVIGLLRQKYTILESTLPINMVMCNSDTSDSMIDKVVTICSALCNCCESVVPF